MKDSLHKFDMKGCFFRIYDIYPSLFGPWRESCTWHVCYFFAPQLFHFYMSEVPKDILCRIMFRVLFFRIELNFFHMCFWHLGVGICNEKSWSLSVHCLAARFFCVKFAWNFIYLSIPVMAIKCKSDFRKSLRNPPAPPHPNGKGLYIVCSVAEILHGV